MIVIGGHLTNVSSTTTPLSASLKMQKMSVGSVLSKHYTNSPKVQQKPPKYPNITHGVTDFQERGVSEANQSMLVPVSRHQNDCLKSQDLEEAALYNCV